MTVNYEYHIMFVVQATALLTLQAVVLIVTPLHSSLIVGERLECTVGPS
jgi:hypothetical protein